MYRMFVPQHQQHLPRWQVLRQDGDTDPDVVRRRVGAHTLPIDPVAVARTLDVRVWYGTDKWISAMRIADGQAHVWIRQGLDLVHHRYGVAHALGHVLLHDGYGDVSAVNHNWQNNSWSDTQVNIFAARLLMPAGLLHQYGPSYSWNAESLAGLFQVTPQVMNYRYWLLNNGRG